MRYRHNAAVYGVSPYIETVCADVFNFLESKVGRDRYARLRDIAVANASLFAIESTIETSTLSSKNAVDNHLPCTDDKTNVHSCGNKRATVEISEHASDEQHQIDKKARQSPGEVAVDAELLQCTIEKTETKNQQQQLQSQSLDIVYDDTVVMINETCVDMPDHHHPQTYLKSWTSCADIIVLSPPWGGPEYIGKSVFDLQNLPCGDGILLALAAYDSVRHNHGGVVYVLHEIPATSI